MTISYAKHFSTIKTPQSESIPGKSMTANSAGGYAFAVDDWSRLNRFLILGSEGGSYYATERKLTIENAQCVVRCLDADGTRTISTIVAISQGGRAPKNDPAIFALAIAAGHKDETIRKLAIGALPDVCRIGTHLFQFVEAVRMFRGWGPLLRRGVGAWYTSRDAIQLAYQEAKYAQRGGWSHRDLLRLAHPGRSSAPTDAVIRWALGGKGALNSREIRRQKDGPVEQQADLSAFLPAFLAAVDEAKSASKDRVISLIYEYNLPRECIPTEYLNSPEVWEALLAKMPLTATIRNLGKMSAIGLLKPLGAASKVVTDRLGDQDYIRKSRIHPMAILLAAKTYGIGHGDKGKLSWSPVSKVNDALDAAFYLAFGNVEPAGKRTLIGLDVSGSMGTPIAGSPLSAREAAAAFAMVIAKTEPQYAILAFSRRFMSLDISGCSRLSDVITRTSNLPFSGTDCALPMIAATQNNLDVDTFMVFTDSETWFGSIHPCQALVQYRQYCGIPARLIVTAFASNEFSIADPSDGGMLDMAGLDSSMPQLASDFSAGRI